MTVIVGVLCTDGAVLVADGAATYGLPTGAAMTIRQSTKKLVGIGNTQLFGCSGAVSLSQAFVEQITDSSASGGGYKLWNKSAIRKFFSGDIYKQVVGPACERANSQIVVTGNRGYQTDTGQHSIFAFVDDAGKPQLAQITPTCQVEFADSNLPFVSVGSGQPAADPFMAFLRDVFCAGREITLQDGKFLAYWAVDLTIRVQPGMVAPPIQMMALFKRGDNWVVEELNDDAAAHAEMVKTVEEKMRLYRSVDEQAGQIPVVPAAPEMRSVPEQKRK
ncbi:MAG: hypothetical protein K2W82_19315 [Candidatus Obscuribacterales bacterium]|nr:hypothetical protein [Candidatus Obscuribacterales bacterium]